MRKIKFRVWDDSINSMFELQKLSFKTDKGMPYGWNIGYKFEKIMQYTGLKDKNGVEIFEDDIIECNYKTGSTRDMKGYVIIHNGMVQLQLPKTHNYYKVNTSKMPFRRIFNIKVIGNIYENPELLK